MNPGAPTLETPTPFTDLTAIKTVSEAMQGQLDKLAPYLARENLDTPQTRTKANALQAALYLLGGTSNNPKEGVATMVDLAREKQEAVKTGRFEDFASTYLKAAEIANMYEFAGQSAAKKAGQENYWNQMWKATEPALEQPP